MHFPAGGFAGATRTECAYALSHLLPQKWVIRGKGVQDDYQSQHECYQRSQGVEV